MIAADQETAKSERGFFERVVGVREIEPAGESGFAASGEKFYGTQRGKFCADGFCKFGEHGNPDSVIAHGFGIVALTKDEENFPVNINGVRAEHGAGADASGEWGVVQLLENEGEGG